MDPFDRDSAARQAELWRKEGDTWEKRGEYARALAAWAALCASQNVGVAVVEWENGC